MSASEYFARVSQLIERIESTQLENIQKAARAWADSIAANRAVHLFGSGHSVIPVMDLFPRYGAYVGLHPIMDPRLMWFNVTGPGGARELLWLERTEGYIDQVLLSHQLDSRDTMTVYSHGGMNAAPVEMALAAKERGLTVVCVTCAANREVNDPAHSSGKSLHDIGDIVIDNCCPLEDALIPVTERPEKVGASSTVAAVTISMAILSETTSELVKRGAAPERIFVSPNVAEVSPENNLQVFRDYMAFEKNL